MTTFLNFGRDVQGYNAYAPFPSTNMFSATLVANTARTVTIPNTNKHWIVSFSYQAGNDVWVDFTGATAAVAAGSSFAATTSSLNPACRSVIGGATISIISAAASTDVGIEFYAISEN